MLQVREIPVDNISLRDEFKREDYSSEKYQELNNSIKQLGILHPLVTLDTSEGLILVSGYRRYQIAKETGLPTVPCVTLKTGIDDAEILRLHENLYREDISPLQEAISFLRLEQTYHFTREKISKLIGKSKSYITQKINILNWPDNLQQALASGNISYSVARELSVVDDLPELTNLLETCVQSGATVRTVLHWVSEWKTKKLQKEAEVQNKDLFNKPDETETKQTSCYLCGRGRDKANLTTVCMCKDCLSIIEDKPVIE